MENIARRGGRRHGVLVTAVLAAGLVASIAAVAADGRIPIGTVPYTISAPGDYYLTADLTLGSGANPIAIAANGVTIDLNGHTITNTSTGSAVIASNGYTNIEIRNGSVVGGNYGIALFSVNGGIITVDHVKVTGFSFSGISMVGASPYPAVQITNNAVSSNVGSASLGIAIDYLSGGRVASNTLVGSGSGGNGSGIFLYGDTAIIVADNSVSAYGTGINANTSSNALKLLRNDASNNATGINVASSSSIDVRENLASSNTATGISFGSVTGCVYRDNTAEGNGTNYSIPGTGVTNGGGNY